MISEIIENLRLVKERCDVEDFTNSEILLILLINELKYIKENAKLV